MTLRPTLNRRHLVAALGAAALVSTFLWLRDAQPSTKDIQHMNTYTDNMTTHCIGRFLMDAPQQALLSKGSYELQIATLETQEQPNLPKLQVLDILDATLAQRQAALVQIETAQNSPKIGGRSEAKFFGSYKPSATTRSIRYATEDGQKKMDGYVVIDKRTFFLQTNAFDQEDVKEFNDFLVEISPTLYAREAKEIPTGPGACFDGGLTTMNPTRGENANWGWGLDGHPDVYFGIRTSTNRDEVEPGILDREQEILKNLGQYLGDIRTLRKRRFVVGGMQAQEWSRLDIGSEGDGKKLYEFQIDIPGLPNDNAAPSISLSLTVGGHGSNGYIPPSLTEGEALALWDAVIKTLRLRPGAI